MPRRQVKQISNSRADRAGEFIRKLARNEVALPERDSPEGLEFRTRVLVALADMQAYRAMHEYPLTKVTIGVRVMIETELGAGAPRPAQRFKRLPRIIEKLARISVRLSQMEDIGGCRAVLPTIDDVRRVETRIRRRWPHAQVTDYIENPKPDGYRSIHIIERRDGRLIEVQLRTARQHEWAEAIETWSAQLPWDLKDGEGPADLRRYFRMAAERLARDDAGLPPDAALEGSFATVREDVRHYLAG